MPLQSAFKLCALALRCRKEAAIGQALAAIGDVGDTENFGRERFADLIEENRKRRIIGSFLDCLSSLELLLNVGEISLEWMHGIHFTRRDS